MHNNKTIVTYGMDTDLKSVKLIQETYGKSLDLMEDLTKINYPLNTLATLIVPEKADAASAASLGLITTKNSHALFNDRFGPQKKKDVIFQSIRDVVGQWFNQLTTPESWKYMWLTEGIIEYIKYHLADKIVPDWRLKEAFVVWELQRRSFIPNKITDGPPLTTHLIDSKKDIRCLMSRMVSVSSKAAAIIRMMTHFLSENIVHSGIANLLKTKLHSSIKTEDFWEAIQNAIAESKDHRVANANITEIMQTWVDAEFYPILNVTRDYKTGLMLISQLPAVTFFELTDKKVKNEWWIPITYTVKSRGNFNRTCPTDWLKPEMELAIEGVDSSDWVLFNIQQTGYYRVLYDEENWKLLAHQLNSDDYHKIPPVNRAQILNDAVQFTLKRHLKTDIFFKLVSYLKREKDYLPWFNAQFILSFLNYHLSNTEAYESFKQFSLKLIIPLVDKIGYEDVSGDDFSTLMLRRISNHWACYLGYEKCWKNATRQLDALLNDKKLDLGATDLQDWAQCVGLYGANEATWYNMFKKYKQNFSEESLVYLACTNNFDILNSFLSMSIANNSIIPKRQVLTVFKLVCLYPSAIDKRLNFCMNFIDENFDKIKYRLEKPEESFTYIFDLIASEIRQKSQLEKFQGIIFQDRSKFAFLKLGSRLKQTESRVSIYEEKANYYRPFLQKIVSEM